MDATRAKRLFFIALIASLSATAALAIVFLLVADFDETTTRILVTTLLLSLASFFALPAGVLLDQGRYRGLAWTTIVLSALAFALSMVVTWRDWEDEGGEGIWKALATLAGFAAASSQAAMTTSRLRAGDTRGVRLLYLGSLALAGILALMITLAAWAEVDHEWYYRLLGALAVADVLLVVVQSVARRLGTATADRRPGHRVVFTLDREPSEEALAEAVQALGRGGVGVERVDRG